MTTLDLTAMDLHALAAATRKKLREQAARKLRSDFVPEPGHADRAIIHIERLARRAAILQEAAFRADSENVRKQR